VLVNTLSSKTTFVVNHLPKMNGGGKGMNMRRKREKEKEKEKEKKLRTRTLTSDLSSDESWKS